MVENKMPTPEVAVLRSLMGVASVSPGDALAVIDETGLVPGDFADADAAAVFSALLAAFQDGRVPDTVTLARNTQGKAARALVVDVATNTEMSFASERAALVKQESVRRNLSACFTALLDSIKNRSADVATVVAEGQKLLAAVTLPGGGKTSEGDLMALVDLLEQVQAGQREPILETGIEALDFMIGGLPQTLTIIGALPGVGKSALLVTILRNLASRGVKVGLLSLEDQRQWVSRRLLAEAAAVPLFVVGKKPLARGQQERIQAAGSGVYNALRNIHIDDTSAMSPAQAVASARQMIARGCKAIFVDHLGELRLERSERHDLDIADALQQLRTLAKTYRVPVVVACHLKRREGMTPEAEPRLTDFAFSAAVERMARLALGLYRNKKGEMGVCLLKQTEGPAGFSFDLSTSKLYGTVAQTPVTQGMRDVTSWRDE